MWGTDAVGAVGRLATRALQPGDLLPVFEEAVDVLVRRLGADHVTVLERVADGGTARVRAGVGWGEGAVGETVGVMPGGHLEFTLANERPVIVEELASETRFVPSPLLLGHRVTSSLAARIPSGHGGTPFGVLGVHTTERRRFQETEAALVAAVAAILALAIARWRQAFHLHDTTLQALIMARYAMAAGDVGSARTHVEEALARIRHIVGDTLGESPLPGDLRRQGA